MALTFKYRYVDFGTVFTGALGVRRPENGAESPDTLYANELVTDVGGTCWGRNEPLSIIDHHFSRDDQFPSASAAVLHKAKLIREKFAGLENDVVWLVTHKQPDFDAFCSLYLARWIIENPGGAMDWAPCGLHPDGWLVSAGKPRIDWFDPDVNQAPVPQRWALQLACYAAIVDNGRRLFCPRQRALHSVLYAALKRGRDYLNDTSGGREFFDEVKASLQEKQLNPMFDSVLEESSRFAPELAMLDREVDAYDRDIRRARKAIVYLPESEAPFPNFFKSVKDVVPLKEKEPGKSLPANAEHLLLADTFRIPTDGIYLRDPECLLFKEWARLDLENSSLGAGFEFTAIAYSGGHPAATINKSEYFFSIDPERANGRHLYTVWSRLQTKEVEALLDREQAPASVPEAGRWGVDLEKRAGDLGRRFTDRWFDGQNSFGTIVATPTRGTMIGRPGARSDLRDDPVAEAVRTDVEDSIYSAESLVAGPQVVVTDFSGSKDQTDASPRQFDLNALQQIPVPREGLFRFGTIPLRADAPITRGDAGRRGLADQISETLWQVLYPDLPDSEPPDFVKHHQVVTADCVGVWGLRGIVMAYKRAPGGDVSPPAGQQAKASDEVLRDDFAAVVALVRDIDQLTKDGERLARQAPSATLLDERRASVQPAMESVSKIVAKGEDLARRAAQVKHNLTLPNRDLLRRFYDAVGIDDLLEALRDLNQTAAGYLRREKLEEQTSWMEASTKTVAQVQSQMEWLQVFIVGFYATAIFGLAFSNLPAGDRIWGMPATLLGGLFFLLIAAWVLKPWVRPPEKKPHAHNGAVWIFAIVALSYIVGLLLWLRFPQSAASQ
jgi:hypothetical protein